MESIFDLCTMGMPFRISVLLPPAAKAFLTASLWRRAKDFRLSWMAAGFWSAPTIQRFGEIMLIEGLAGSCSESATFRFSSFVDLLVFGERVGEICFT